jgi:hypothetical protein
MMATVYHQQSLEKSETAGSKEGSRAATHLAQGGDGLPDFAGNVRLS